MIPWRQPLPTPYTYIMELTRELSELGVALSSLLYLMFLQIHYQCSSWDRISYYLVSKSGFCLSRNEFNFMLSSCCFIYVLVAQVTEINWPSLAVLSTVEVIKRWSNRISTPAILVDLLGEVKRFISKLCLTSL